MVLVQDLPESTAPADVISFMKGVTSHVEFKNRWQEDNFEKSGPSLPPLHSLVIANWM